MMLEFLRALTRLLNGFLRAKLRSEVKEAENNPADELDGDGRVQQSDESFTSLSAKSKRDQAE